MKDSNDLQRMTADVADNELVDLKPLETYLKPWFSDLYDNTVWTPELQEACYQYLLDASSGILNDLCKELECPPPPDAFAIQDKLAAIFRMNDPVSVIGADHWATVKRVPTLGQLLNALPSPIDLDEVGFWMEHHATPDQLIAFARNILPSDRFMPSEGELKYFYVPHWLAGWKSNESDLEKSRAELFDVWTKAWIEVTGSLASDNTPRQDESSIGDIRAWAQANGLHVGQRGKIRSDVIAAYQAAHQ